MQEVVAYMFQDADGGLVERTILSEDGYVLAVYADVMSDAEIEEEISGGNAKVLVVPWREAASSFPAAFAAYNREHPGAFKD